MPSPLLTTQRLRLRPFVEDDVEALHTIFTTPEVRRYLLDDQLVTRDWVRDEVQASEAMFAERGCGLWCVVAARDASVLGFAGFRNFFDPPQLQLLYGLAPTVWGQGLATEAAQGVIGYAFESLGFSEISAAVDAPNVASIAVLERLGFSLSRSAGQGAYGQTLFFRLVRD